MADSDNTATIGILGVTVDLDADGNVVSVSSADGSTWRRDEAPAPAPSASDDFLRRFADDLAAQQEPLDAETEKVLRANLWDLYVGEPVASAPAPSGEVAAEDAESDRVVALLLSERGADEDDDDCRECGVSVDWRGEVGDVCDPCASDFAYFLAHALKRARAAVTRLAADNARLTDERDNWRDQYQSGAKVLREGVADLRARLDAVTSERGALAAELDRAVEVMRNQVERLDAAERERDAVLRDLATARAAAFEEAARAIDNWPHVAAILRALAAKGGA